MDDKTIEESWNEHQKPGENFHHPNKKCAWIWRCHLAPKENSDAIERVQKTALAIILSPDYRSYDEALEITKLEKLDKRRIALSLNFAKKAIKHPEHSKWFSKQDASTNVQTRAFKPPYKPVQARTNRLLKSPVPYLTQLLNIDATKKLSSLSTPVAPSHIM